MKAREYIEQSFIPWILTLDPKDTYKHFSEGKEEYLLETYNHISKEFKSLDHYELYMFRLNIQKMMLPIGMSEMIIVNLPEAKNVNDSAYMILIKHNENYYYYTVKHLVNDEYQLVKCHNFKKENLTIGSLDLDFFINEIRLDLLK